MTNGTTVALVSVGSALIGFAAGLAFSKHRQDVERKARIAEIKSKVEVEQDVVDESTPEKGVETDKDLVKNNRTEKEYTNYIEAAKTYTKSEDFDLIDVTFPDDLDEDGNPMYPENEDEYDTGDNEVTPIEALEARMKDREIPKQISVEAFLANELDYDQETWTYYQADDMVLNFFDMPVEREKEFIGNAKELLDKEDDDSSIFMRSLLHRTEIELVLCKQPFEETVAGLKQERKKKVIERRMLND